MPRRRIRSSEELPVARSSAAASLATDTYWTRSMRPLHVLVFLLPLLVSYEIGSILFLTDPQAGTRRTIDALRLMRDLFDLLGVAGSLVPGVAMATVLIVWHILRRDPWTLDTRTLGGMLAEAAAWTLPLLVLLATVQHASSTLAAGFAIGSTAESGLVPLVQESTRRLLEQPVPTRLTIAIGAGLYEEMLFRLVGLALLHFILADLIGIPGKWASAAAVVLSALAFAIYHHPQTGSEWAMYLLSGIYLGTVYVMRGFGIVVGAHALYDVLVLAVQPALVG